MIVTTRSSISVPVFTTVTAVDIENGVAIVSVELSTGEGSPYTVVPPHPSLIPPEEWREVMTAAVGVRVQREVYISAVPATDVIGSGRMVLETVQMADNFYAEFELTE